MSFSGLFPLPDSDSDLHTDSCTMQDFPTGSDLDSDPLIEMYAIDGNLSLRWWCVPKMGTVTIWERDPNQSLSPWNRNMFCIILCSRRVWNPSPGPNLNPSPAVETSHNAYLVDHGAAGGERGLWGGAGDAGTGTRGRWGCVHQAEG